MSQGTLVGVGRPPRMGFQKVTFVSFHIKRIDTVRFDFKY